MDQIKLQPSLCSIHKFEFLPFQSKKKKIKIKIITQVSNYMYMYHNFSTHIVIL